jgi:hypothetical protein
MVLFADDTSIIVTDINKLNFEINLKQTYKDIITWFISNLLALNLDKIQYMEFRHMNFYNVTTKVNYEQISLKNVTETKFLGLIIDDTLTWKRHIEYLKKKMSLACFALRNIKDTVSLDALKLIYFANVHSIISYGIILWSDSSCANKVFILQKKKDIRIITNSRSRESCRDILKKLEIMTIYDQYIYIYILISLIHN